MITPYGNIQLAKYHDPVHEPGSSRYQDHDFPRPGLDSWSSRFSARQYFSYVSGRSEEAK